MLINWLWWLFCRAFKVKGPIYDHEATMEVLENEWDSAYR